MSKNDDLKIRMEQLIQVFRDSPSVTVTYIDLARVYEFMLDIMKNNEAIGFDKKG